MRRRLGSTWGPRVVSEERGASAVEAALVTPVVFALLIGILEFGIAFKDYLGVQAMVRSGVRTASAEPRLGSFAQDTVDRMVATGTVVPKQDIQQLWVYKANDTDDFPSGSSSFADCTTCVKFAWNATTKVFTPISNTWAASAQNACPRAVNANRPPDRIGIYVQLRHNSISGMIRPLTISEATAMYLEPYPTPLGCGPRP